MDRKENGKKNSNFFYVRHTDKSLRMANRSQYERSEAFRESYLWLAAMSQYDRLTGAKRLRVRGFKAVQFAAVIKAIAVNIARAVTVEKARSRAQGPNPDQY
jgi:hypothetical protein